jgi:hypothetical protein
MGGTSGTWAELSANAPPTVHLIERNSATVAAKIAIINAQAVVRLD